MGYKVKGVPGWTVGEEMESQACGSGMHGERHGSKSIYWGQEILCLDFNNKVSM